MVSGRGVGMNYIKLFTVNQSSSCEKDKLSLLLSLACLHFKDVPTVNDILLYHRFVKTSAYVLTRQGYIKYLHRQSFLIKQDIHLIIVI